MNSIYNIYTMFYDPIEPLLYSTSLHPSLLFFYRRNRGPQDHHLRADLRQNGDPQAPIRRGLRPKRLHRRLRRLHGPPIRDFRAAIARPIIGVAIRRSSNPPIDPPNHAEVPHLRELGAAALPLRRGTRKARDGQAIDGFLPLSVEKPVAAEIFALMNQVGEQFASLRYSCFLFDGYFVAMLGRLEGKVWSDIAMENLNLLRHFHLTNQGACFFLEISRRSDAERAAEGLFDDRHGGNDRVFVRNRRDRRSRRCRCAFPTTPASCSASRSVFSAMWYLCFHD